MHIEGVYLKFSGFLRKELEVKITGDLIETK